ncbi:MAG: hypothetical protein IPL61_04950 [Myxococcales bacterium]|nr:hypothetical protein [Myxococcales bacterium]
MNPCLVVIPCALALACTHPAPAAPPPQIGNRPGPLTTVDASAGLRDGALWTCQIDDYDPQPCRLARRGDGWFISKLLGSQRFRGAIAFTPDGARLSGEYFCPWGDCTMPIDVAFTRDGDRYQAVGDGGDLAPPTISLRYDADDDAAFGGAGYGGLTGDER